MGKMSSALKAKKSTKNKTLKASVCANKSDKIADTLHIGVQTRSKTKPQGMETSHTFVAPPSQVGIRSKTKADIKELTDSYIRDPPALNIAPVLSQDRSSLLITEGSKIANVLLCDENFLDELVRCGVDQATCLSQAKKVRISFKEPVSMPTSDTSHSLAWTNITLGLNNVDIYLNLNILAQIESFKIRKPSYEWKQYVFMVGIIIFHEFAHLSIRWVNKDSPDVDTGEMGLLAERRVFRKGHFYFIFDKKPTVYNKRIDGTIKLVDFELSDMPNSAVKKEYIEDVYMQVVQSEPVDSFDISEVRREAKNMTECWRTRVIDQAPIVSRTNRDLGDHSTPVNLGRCMKVIARNLEDVYVS